MEMLIAILFYLGLLSPCQTTITTTEVNMLVKQNATAVANVQTSTTDMQKVNSIVEEWPDPLPEPIPN